jgi:hypothetical protein
MKPVLRNVVQVALPNDELENFERRSWKDLPGPEITPVENEGQEERPIGSHFNGSTITSRTTKRHYLRGVTKAKPRS